MSSYGLTHQFHVVDQRVSMLPGGFRVTAKGHCLHLLGPVQLTESGGEQQGGVVHQGGLRLKTIFVADPLSRV